jgi:hypothetical protein
MMPHRAAFSFSTTTDPLDRTYKRDKDGRFGSGDGSGKTPEMLHDDEATIKGVYNYTDEATGLSTRVDSIRSNGPGFSTYVSGSILDRGGNVVGGFERDIRPAGQATVHHGGLVLAADALTRATSGDIQGQGFATRYNAATEAAYREHGIKKITLNANIDVGGYAWAKAGYQFASPHARQTVADRAHIKGLKFNPDVQAKIRAVANNPHSSPIDFAMIGHEPGASTWPGKQIMLGSNWDGVKEL